MYNFYNEGYNWDGLEYETQEIIDMINHYARKIAHRFNHIDIYHDLQSIGHMAIRTAADKYDSDMGVKFVTYANKFVKYAMLEEARVLVTAIWIPKDTNNSILKVKKIWDQFHNEMDEETLLELISEELDITKKTAYKYLSVYDNLYNLASLEETIWKDDTYDGEDTTSYDVEILTDDAIMQEVLVEELEEEISKLPELEANILRMRYCDERIGYETIGKMYGKTPAGIKYIEQRTLKRLRRSAKLRKLYDVMIA